MYRKTGDGAMRERWLFQAVLAANAWQEGIYAFLAGVRLQGRSLPGSTIVSPLLTNRIDWLFIEAYHIEAYH